jgi:hypothetical protein
MALLVHGTTRQRAERIRSVGPDPDYVESPGGGRAEGFSTYLAQGPFLFGRPEEYACAKAASFPGEGGAVILLVEVPDEIIALAASDWLPLSQGLVQFDEGAGLGELIAAWPQLRKQIRTVNCP